MKNKKNILYIITLFFFSLLFMSFLKTDTDSKIKQEKSGIIYFVRHAEKEKKGEDPVLTKQGTQRAEETVPIFNKI